MDVQLTPDQLEAAQSYLDSLDKNTLQRGRSYLRQGRVLKIEPAVSGDGFYASVKGTGRYRVEMDFEEGGWDGVCSCPVAFDCKHCCAAMLAVMEASRADAKPEPQKAADARSIASLETDNETFSALIAQRFGRKLTPEEKRAATAVDEIYTNHRTSKFIAENLLDRITGRRSSWGWNTIEFWPTQPHSPWEAWLYIVALLRRNKWSCPAALLNATDQTEVDALVSSWERRENIERWRDWLQQNAGSQETAAPETAELRVRLNEKGAQLEWRKAGANDFSPSNKPPTTSSSSPASAAIFRSTRSRSRSGVFSTPAMAAVRSTSMANRTQSACSISCSACRDSRIASSAQRAPRCAVPSRR